MSDFLSKEVLQEILKTNDQGRIVKRESNVLEFKQNFLWKNKSESVKYIHTIAAFANKKGGHIVFGVKNNPKEVVGIDEGFDEVDDADIASFVNTYLSPSIEYERTTFKVKGKFVGVLYVHEAKHKPVVCIRTYDKTLFESTIYYRYNSQSDRIKSGDLLSLLNEVRERESERWFKLFQNISKVGVDNARVMNIEDGIITSSTGNKFIIDEKLLGRLKVLDSYTSKEKDGAPAVRIIGDIDTSGTIITKSRYLYDSEIMCDFLDKKEINNAEEYLKAICYQSSGMLPFYYYISQGGLTLNEAIDIVKTVNKHSQSKTKLLARLEDDSKLDNLFTQVHVDAETTIGAQRKKYFEDIANEIDFPLPKNERQLKSLLEAILNLVKSDIKDNTFSILKEILLNNYDNKNLAPSIRNAIAYVDFMLYRNNE